MKAGTTRAATITVCALLGCGPVEERNAPPLPGGGRTSGATPGGPSPDSGVAGSGGIGVPAHCRPDDGTAGEGEGTSTGTGGDDAFKFDVGAPEGDVTFEFGCEGAAAHSSNLGCEFWAVDLPNDDQGTFVSPPAADQQFSVAVGNPSGLADAHVDVYLPGAATLFASAVVEPGETHTFPLPSASIEANFGSFDGLGYHIVSDIPIVAYQFNPLDNTTEVYSNDASLLLPTHALGNDYVAVTGGAILLSRGAGDPEPRNAGAYVSVLATEDDTDVQLDPTAPLAGGTTRTRRLGKGQVWTVISSGASGSTGNLSGTRVRASAPVAVFSGNVATIVPLASEKCCADHIEHQLSPRTAWASRYAVAPPPSTRGEGNARALYRLTGAFDGTRLLYCPERPEDAPESLDAGETLEFQSDAPFTVIAEDPEHAFGVAQFLLSNEAASEDGLGDPAMLILPSAVQLESRLAFVVPAGYLQTHITIVAQDVDAVMLDGERVPDGWFQPLGVLDGERFHYLQLDVTEGQHFLEGAGRVGVSVFGYDEAVSFAYPGGAGLRTVSFPPAAG